MVTPVTPRRWKASSSPSTLVSAPGARSFACWLPLASSSSAAGWKLGADGPVAR